MKRRIKKTVWSPVARHIYAMKDVIAFLSFFYFRNKKTEL